MCDADAIVKAFREEKRRECPIYELVEDQGSSLYEQMVACAVKTPRKFPMFTLRPKKGSSLCRPRVMNDVLALIPDELEVKSYRLIRNDRVPGIYRMNLDVVQMSKAEYGQRAKGQFVGLDYTYGLYPTREVLDRFVEKEEGNNLAMLYAHDVSYSVMDGLDDIPVEYRLSSLNAESGFKQLLQGKEIDGVNTPMTYLSVTPSGSSWHEEDFGLASANWLLPGSDTKFWIGKVVEQQNELIRPIRKAYKHSCVNPLSHKDYVFAYDHFLEADSPGEFYYVEQEGGDIVCRRGVWDNICGRFPYCNSQRCNINWTCPNGVHYMSNVFIQWSKGVH